MYTWLVIVRNPYSTNQSWNFYFKQYQSVGDYNLPEIDWCRENRFWQERGVTQIGAKGEPIISNTKTTVDACYQALREFVGIAPASGLI